MTGEAILVTGGAGFIGSHACKALAAAGYAPVAFDNLSTGHRDAVRWGPFVEGDVRDKAQAAAAIREFGAVAVMHFAAYSNIGDSVANPLTYHDNNVVGLLRLLEACREAGVQEFVFSSSCAVYGAPATAPIDEAQALAPVNPYGRTKQMGEDILADCARAHGVRFTSLRYFNAAGADPAGELAERHDPETHLIPRALLAASGQAPPLQIFGDDYPTDDGTCIRDYVHVSDLAAGHVLALRRLRAGGDSLAVNLGSGEGRSVFEVLASVQSATGRPVPHKIAPRRPGDPPILFADTTKARAVLDFQPRRSDLTTMMRDAAPGFGCAPLAVG